MARKRQPATGERAVRVEADARLEVKLPLPPQELYPNASVTWRRKIRPKKAAREMAALVARQEMAGQTGWPYDRATLHVRFRLPRRRDDDNLWAWLKAYRDGLADAGIVANDADFTSGTLEQITGSRLHSYGVIFFVELFR